MADIVMPRLSDSMEEGTILTWMKQVGDEIAVGDEIVEIETDKANMAYESRRGGNVDGDLGRGGATLPIGTPMRGSGIRRRRRPPLRVLTRGRLLRARTWLRSRSSPRQPPETAAATRRRSDRAEDAAVSRLGLSGSKRRRSRGGWLRSKASTWRRSQGSGPGGGS